MIVLAFRTVDSTGSGSSKNGPPRNRLLRLKLGFRTLMLGAGTITIGRKSTCDLVLDDPQISREHARVIVSDASAAIQDLSSGNGVQVNGRRIQGLQRLAIGDRIQIGVHTIEVLGPSDTGPSVHDESEVTRIGKVPGEFTDERPTSVKNPRKP